MNQGYLLNLHASEGGVREIGPDSGASTYANQLASYISDPAKVRAYVLMDFQRSPSIDDIRLMRERHMMQRAKFRRSWEALGEKDSDAAPFRVRRTAKWEFEKTKPGRQPGAPQPRPIKPIIFAAELVAAIAVEFGITLQQLQAKDRRKTVVHARQTAAYVLVSRGNSTPQAARFLGLNDHTTVVHAVGKFRKGTATPEMRAVAAKYLGRPV